MERLITNKILAIQNDSHSQNLGLFVGDMGICLALHLMNRTYNIPQAEAEADKLLKHIYENLKHLQNTGFKNGLSGIGWALCILKGQSCIEGNIDEILLNIDAVIYKSLTDIKYNVDINLLDGLIGNHLNNW
ncbi:MAG: hypothetical protein IJR87_06400 [Bacteroidaceae bacterium]|nr:hypothetical protein [Bacteroidaceae bacterium]